MFKVAPFTAKFLGQVMQIEESSFQEDMFSQALFEDLLNNPNVMGLVALTTSNKVTGYIMLRYTNNEAEILTIAVAKQFLKQGIGSILLENSLKNLVAGNINEVFLEVRPTNISAIKLYKKFGAKKIGTRKNYYQNEDADVYLLKLGCN